MFDFNLTTYFIMFRNLFSFQCCMKSEDVPPAPPVYRHHVPPHTPPNSVNGYDSDDEASDSDTDHVAFTVSYEHHRTRNNRGMPLVEYNPGCPHTRCRSNSSP